MPRSGKCKTNLNNFDIGPTVPYPTLPGFGLNINIPGFDIPFPEGFPENIFDLLNKLKLRWPGGISLSGLLDNFMRKLSQLISNLLTQLATFLAIYNLILAIIEMIICIIEVICAAFHPIKFQKKLKRLFRYCLPIFISIFPFLALLALILAIIALLLALIEYIIAMLKKIWEELKKNFERLERLARESHTAGALAVAKKVASILCILENVVVMLMLIKIVIDIIRGIQLRTINPPCKDNDCTSDCDLCPACAPILRNPENVVANDAVLSYTSWMDLQTSQILEAVYLTADNLPAGYRLGNIISSVVGNCPVGPFFPPQAFPAGYDITRAPYIVNLTYPNFTDGYGTRDIIIRNVLVSYAEMYTGYGRFTLLDGTTEDAYDIYDGWTVVEFLRGNQDYPTIINNYSVTSELNEFIPNYDSLLALGLITIDCNPEIIIEKEILYSSINTNQLDGLVFPDLEDITSRIDIEISKFREKINADTIDEFIDNMNAIMEDAKAQAENTYTQAFNFMVSPLHSTAELTPTVQFITQPIEVKAILKTASSQTIPEVAGEFPIPTSTLESLKSKLTSELSFGTISSFEYDGYGNFIANITSATAGNGIIKLFYDGQQFSEVVRPDSLANDSQIVALEWTYEFVGPDTSIRGMPRRDETDIANS